MELWKKKVNAEWMESLKSVLKEGGVWVWPGAGHAYTLQNGELVGDSEQADQDLKDILPPKK